MWQCIVAAALGCATLSAWGFDLLDAYRDALANDANFMAARSALAAARENLPQARAGLLPQVSANAQRTRNSLDQRQTLPTGGTINRESSYTADSATLALRQPLYRRLNWAQLSFAEAQVAAAEAGFEKDRQDAGLRVAQAYFEVLFAQTRVRVLEAQLEAFAGQLKLAERAFATGAGTRTDIDDARARALQAKAGLTEANYALDNARRTLAALIGKPPPPLADVVPARLPLAPAEPAVLDHWLRQMEAASPELASLRHQVEMARQDIEKQRAGHHPTLDLIAARQYGSSDTTVTLNQRNIVDYLGVQLALPIYSGGGVSAAVRQAEANLDKTQFQLEAARQRIGVDTQRYFHGVAQGVEKVRAFEAALEAAEQAVVSSRKGFEAGTRTQVDVLDALQRVAEVAQGLARARYEFLLNRMQLAAVTGQLDDELITRINGALGRP
ncbi:MAG: TolC family outer membrane protein [Betaproteobacteria bacterium]|nr:TolC family outer membrane protein [Betaproteobacteria bacterium]